MALELASCPLTVRGAEPPNVAYRLLANLHARPRRRAAVLLPASTDFPRHAWYMTNSTLHWHPLVNGYSDHIPQRFPADGTAMSSFPTRESFRVLKGRRARYVVFHLNWYDRRSREKLLARLDAVRPVSVAAEP